MDWGALVSAGVVMFMCLVALLVGVSFWSNLDSKSKADRDWAAETSNDNATLYFNFGGMVLAVVWIVIAEIVARQWSIVILFTSLYSLGYASGALIAVGTVKTSLSHLKQPPAGVSRTRVINYWIFAIVFVLTALSLVVTVDQGAWVWLFGPSWLTTQVGNATWTVNGYAILGIFLLCVCIALSIRMFLVRRGTLKKLIAAIDKEGPSDAVLRASIIERLNSGLEVKRDNFSAVERDRLQSTFEEIAGSLDEASQLDPSGPSLMLKNAAAIKNVHQAFVNLRQALTDAQRAETSHALAAVLLSELGLPAPTVSRVSNPAFTMDMATHGALAAVLPDRFPILVTALDETGIRQSDVPAALEQALTQAATRARFGVAIAAHTSPLLRGLLTQADAGGLPQHVVYLDEDRIRSILATNLPDIKQAFMDQVRRSVDLSIVAPFVTKGPTTGLMFVGRSKEIGTILQDVESRSYAIVGGRRIGKTSMLHQIKLRLEQRGYAVLYMDCSNARDYATFADLTQLDWSDNVSDVISYLPESPANDLPIAFQRLVAALTAKERTNKRLVFMFDEIDLLLFADMNLQPPEQLFRGFRVLSQTDRCQFIFGGERRIFEQLRDPASPLFNFCMPVRPGLLTSDEALKLVEEPFAMLNIPLLGDHDVSRAIAEACSYHPNLIQWVCAEIVRALDPDDIQPSIDTSLVGKIIAHPQFRREYLEVFWGQATALEQAITILVSQDTAVSLQGILHRLLEADYAITQDELRTAFDYLALYCILEPSSDGVQLLAQHLPEYIAAEFIDPAAKLKELSKEYQRHRTD